VIDLSADFFLWVASSLFILIVAWIAVLIGRRALRGQALFTDTDWRFLFGRSKEQVLTWSYWGKLGFLLLICSVLSAAEYLIILPYGEGWYLASVAVTFAGIIVLGPAIWLKR